VQVHIQNLLYKGMTEFPWKEILKQTKQRRRIVCSNAFLVGMDHVAVPGQPEVLISCNHCRHLLED